MEVDFRMFGVNFAMLDQKRVVVAVWRLANGNCFRTISKTMTIGNSTAVKITKQFCQELSQ